MGKELLFSITRKDLKIQFFSGTGAGGQYRNKHQNCIRIQHAASGAIVTGQSARERQANIREAMTNLVKNPKFKIWHTQKVNEILTGKTLADIVNEMIKPENLKIEIKQDGKWIEARAAKED